MEGVDFLAGGGGEVVEGFGDEMGGVGWCWLHGLIICKIGGKD